MDGKVRFWASRSISVVSLIYVLLILYFDTTLSIPFFGKLLLSAILLVTLFIAFTNEPVGGAVYIIFGSLAFVVLLAAQLISAFLLPIIAIYSIGIVFIVNYLLVEKKNNKAGSDL
jgi:hypothetical protein